MPQLDLKSSPVAASCEAGLSTAPALKIAHVGEEVAIEVADRVTVGSVALFEDALEFVGPVSAVLLETPGRGPGESIAYEPFWHCG